MLQMPILMLQTPTLMFQMSILVLQMDFYNLIVLPQYKIDSLPLLLYKIGAGRAPLCGLNTASHPADSAVVGQA